MSAPALAFGQSLADIARKSCARYAVDFMRKTLVLLLAGIALNASAEVSVNGHWEVTLLKGTTTVPPASVGATQDEAFADCLRRIAAPVATSGTASFKCQTSRYVATVTYSPAPPTVKVSWTAPTKNTDGSPLTDLIGYRVVYGTSPTALNQSVSTTETEYTFNNLPRGTWYFAAIAVAAGGESDLSNIATKTL